MADMTRVSMSVRGAEVVTVPIDDTLTIEGQAADAKATGDALALKADKSELQAAVKVNNQPADAQGLILIDGRHIPVNDQDAETLAEAVGGLKDMTAAEIHMSSEADAKTIAEEFLEVQEAIDANTEAIENMEEMTGATMPIESGSQTTVKAAIEARVKTVNQKAPDTDGNVDLSVVPLAENLQSDKMESVDGTFIIRTTGGSSSVSDGKAYPQHIMGTSERTGYVAEELNMTVIPIERTEPDEPITATIDRDVFVAYVDESGTINLYYTTEWSEDPELYGVIVEGTPVAGDQIQIVYVKEQRGTIQVSNPERLVGTGWNLFNFNAGYARVVRYSDEYGYKIGGAFTSIEYSATPEGDRVSILPGQNGLFQVPGDGYVFVSGGNATDTYILATWSDWTDGPATGYWEAYKESGIDLSAVMGTYFPYGMLSVGTIHDEIDLSAKRTISRVERMAYTAENLEAAIASGREFTYDTNYIYLERAENVISAITIDTVYNVSEHGLEWFTGTTMPLITEILYGKNLRDKLERDVLTISEQTLAEEEKAQVRKNIGVMDPPLNGYGTANQLLKTNGDGTTEWTTQGTPTDEQVGTAVSAWLTAHPEATTTVQDGAISRAKLNDDLKAKTDAVPALKSTLNDVCPEIIKIFGTDIYNLANATQVKKTAGYITVDNRSISMRANGSVSNGIHVVFSAEHNTDYELVCLNPSGYTAKLKADTSIPSSYSNNNVGTSNKVNSGNNDYIIASFSIPKEQIDYYTFSSIALIKNSKIDLIEEIQTGLTKKATMLGYFANSTQAGTYNDLNQLPTGTFAIYAYSSGKVHAPTSTFTGAVLTLGGVLGNDGGGDFAPQLAIDRYGALYVRGRYSNYTDWFEIAKKSEIDAIMPLVNKALFASKVLKISNTTVDTSENRADGYFNTTGTLVANASGGAFYTPTSISIKAGQTIHAHAIGYQSSMSIITSGSSGNGSPIAISETDKTDYYYTAMGNMQIRVCCMNSFADSFYVEIVSSDIIETILEELHPNKYNIATFKRYGVCGDSLASGESAHNEGGTVGYVDLYDFSWVQFIARKTGNEAINFSKGGLNTRTWLTNSSGLTKLQNPDNKCDCYFIGLGVNDLSLGSEYLGSISDVNTSDPTQSSDTFYGNYAKIIGYIRQVQPKAIIFCITIPNPNDETLVTSFNTAIQTVCSTLNCCLIELTDEDDAITSANKRWGHYNAWGYNQWAEIIMNHVNDYMSANPSKFRQIEFIGTDYSWNS